MGGWYIKSTYYTRFLNWNKVLEKRVVTSKTPFFVIGPSCAPYSICLNIGSWQGSFVWKFCVFNSPSRHGCFSDASLSLRRLKQRLRDISKRADLQIWDVSREIYLKRLLRDISETSQAFSEMSLSCIWDCNSWLSNWGMFWQPVHLPTRL